MNEPPEVSVLIVSWNVAADLEQCLRSLLDGGNRVAFEIVVVDNASSDGSAELVRNKFPSVRLIVNEENAGFARANNQAWQVSRGRYCLLTNPDTVLPRGALDKLVAFADAHPQAGIIGPRLLNPDGSLQQSCRTFPRPLAALFRGTLLGRLFPNHPAVQEYLMENWEHDDVRAVDWVSGACMFVRRRAVEGQGDRAGVGLLDEGFWWGSEDVDWCYRMHQAGWQVLYTPEPAVVHAIGRSADQAVVRAVMAHHRSMYRLYAKHFSRNVLSRWAIGALVYTRGVGIVLSHWLRTVWALARRRL